MQRITLLIAFAFAAQFAKSQTTFSLGTTGTFANSSYTTNIYKVDADCACGFYSNGSGGSQSAGLEGYVRSAVAPSTRLVGFFGIANFSAKSNWIEPGDSLPSLDCNGNYVLSILEHRLSYDTRGHTITAGIGLEYGIVSLVPFLRVTPVKTASTVNRMSIVSPESAVFDQKPDLEYENNARSVVIMRLPSVNHTSVLIDAGAMVGLTLETDFWGIRFVGCAQAYFLSGINNIHIAYPTKLNYEYGGRLFVGVGL